MTLDATFGEAKLAFVAAYSPGGNYVPLMLSSKLSQRRLNLNQLVLNRDNYNCTRIATLPVFRALKFNREVGGRISYNAPLQLCRRSPRNRVSRDPQQPCGGRNSRCTQHTAFSALQWPQTTETIPLLALYLSGLTHSRCVAAFHA